MNFNTAHSELKFIMHTKLGPFSCFNHMILFTMFHLYKQLRFIVILIIIKKVNKYKNNQSEVPNKRTFFSALVRYFFF